MENIMVIGAGFMGSGIARGCARSGYRVFLMDTDPAGLEKAIERIKWSIEKLASKGYLNAVC